MSIADFNEAIEQFRVFAEKEIGLFALDADLEPSNALVKTIWRKSESLGMPALPFPESAGGRGYPDFCLALLLDVVSAACPGMASVYAHHYAACLSFLNADADQLTRFLTDESNVRLSGTPICAMLFPKKEGEEKLSLKSRNGDLSLSGVSSLTGNVHFADKFFVFAKDGDLDGGLTCLMVDAGKKGVSISRTKHFSGLKLNPMAEVTLGDVSVSPEDIVGIRGRGGKILEESLLSFHNFLAAMIMGAVRNALKKAFDYAEDRYQFGAQIIHHQEIQKILRRMMLKLNQGTSAYIKMFENPSKERPSSLEETLSIRKQCKSYACEIIMDALKIENDTIHVNQYGLDKIIRDVVTLAIIDRGEKPHPAERLHRKVG